MSTLEAVFENGKFRPLEPSRVPLSERQRVRIIAEAEEQPDDVLALAGRAYDSLSEEEIDAVESIALDRGRRFERPGAGGRRER